MSSLIIQRAVMARDLIAQNQIHSEVPPENFTCPKCGEGTGISYSYLYDRMTCGRCGKEAAISEFNLAPQRERFEDYYERRIDDLVDQGVLTGGTDSPAYRHRLQHPTHQEQVRLKELGSGQ